MYLRRNLSEVAYILSFEVPSFGISRAFLLLLQLLLRHDDDRVLQCVLVSSVHAGVAVNTVSAFANSPVAETT